MTNKTASPPASYEPIGPEDVIEIQGRYLVKKKDGSRFFIKGIAFPIAIGDESYVPRYNAPGWIAVLDQLRQLDVSINTIRLYDVDCISTDYSEFLNYAASIGIYVIFPLTSANKMGVLNRDLPAPKCYKHSLYEYGKHCMDVFSQYPNVIAAMVANEVMNSLKSWKAAPCIVGYARDLKRHQQSSNSRTIPLIYAAQHDALTAAVSASETMRLTQEYLSCGDSPAIDIFAVNMEAWCSSEQTYEYNPTGHYPGVYLDLYQQLENSTVPLLFSELGCSKELFNRDNDLPKGARDWKQLEVIANQMSDRWSGFCAYSYGGNSLFTMMEGWRWDGVNVLEPSQDLYNFRDALSTLQDPTDKPIKNKRSAVVACDDAYARVDTVCMENLYNADRMPSYSTFSLLRMIHGGLVVVLAAIVLAFVLKKKCWKRKSYMEVPHQTELHV